MSMRLVVIIGLLSAVCLAAEAADFFAVTTGNVLERFSDADPGTVTVIGPITGLVSGNVVGIDFRPADNQLYAVGSDSRLYTINLGTAVATQVGTGLFSPLLSGTEFSIDFNPVVDRLRVVSDNGQNLRVNPLTGAVVAADTNLATGPVAGYAYTNSYSGAIVTVAYAIDANAENLALLSSPNTGGMATVGGLGVVTSSAVGGFDISPLSGVGFAALEVGGNSQLYTINVTTGAATLVGAIGGADVRDIALAPAFGSIQFTVASTGLPEQDGPIVLTVTRTGGSTGSVSVLCATSDGSALAGSDYTAISSTITFAAGEVSKTVSIQVTQDTVVEDTEIFTVQLSAPGGGAALGEITSLRVLIADQNQQPADVFALTGNNHLLSFNSATPGVIVRDVAISGLVANDTLLGIDVRPSNRVLYGVGISGRVYTVNTSSGVATAVGASAFAPLPAGSEFGLDVNPVVDRLRLVSNTGQNLRVNPADGSIVATDTPLAYAIGDAHELDTPRITAAAYTNNITGAPTTSLYVIDSVLGVLAIQDPPNNGTLTTIGSLGMTIAPEIGFDIRGEAVGTALISLREIGDSSWSLYLLDLGTGATQLLGAIGGSQVIRDIAIATGAGSISPALGAGSSATPNVKKTSLGPCGVGGGTAAVAIALMLIGFALRLRRQRWG